MTGNREEDAADATRYWQPPERPEWLSAFLTETRSWDADAVAPLQTEELIATARRRTGLTDFGADHWREPFELSDMAMSKFMKDRQIAGRPHGFRATFRTWVEEQTDTPFEVKESALGHMVDSDVVRAYQRSDRFERRRALMLAWEHFLLSPQSNVAANT